MWWAGLTTSSLRDKFAGYQGYKKIADMQFDLLRAGGKKCSLWQRVWDSVEKCPCIAEDVEHPQNPHSICFGTGFVGGYTKLGYRDWILYRLSSTTIRFWDGTTGTNLTISASAVTTDWVDGQNSEAFSLIKWIRSSRSGATVSFSVDGTNWTNSLSLPVTRFKIKLSGIDNSFESCRVRTKTGVDFIYLSENPPRRLEEMLKAGFNANVGDIRCWTISDLFTFYSGDLIQWEEGIYTGHIYVVSDLHISQFPETETITNKLTQIVTMRKAKEFEQLGRII